MRIDRNKIGRKFFVAVHDLVALNAWVFLCALATSFIDDAFWQLDEYSLHILTTLGYFVGLYFVPITLERRALKVVSIFRRCVSIGVVICIFYLALVALLKLNVPNLRHNFLVIVLEAAVLFGSRLAMRAYLGWWWRHYGSTGRILLIGSSDAMLNLCHALANESDSEVIGYFADRTMEISVGRLGAIDEGLEYLRSHHVDEVFCDFTLDHAWLTRIYLQCEDSFVRFFGVPDVYAYLNRRLLVSTVEEVPVLAVREEPLVNPFNRFLKRAFDLVFSTFVLVFLFPPVFLVSAIFIKRQSPGPVFFRQKRTGMDGREFWCLKFRSMRTNDQADVLQATEDDLRKYPYGAFLRRTNLDELPQFINVLLGDMSVVGPRPHMLKHTEQYRELIGRYMVRHLAKPGITGWAQVNGLRGMTKDVGDMERRVRHDIWYVEHWSFGLDLIIIFKTALQTLFCRSENAY